METKINRNPAESSREAALARKSVVDMLKECVEGLLYPSESDERLKVIDWQADHQAPFNTILFRKYIGLPATERVETMPWEKFFDVVLNKQDWWTDNEIERAEKFATIKKIMEENLTELEYLRAGRVEIEAYLIGKDADGKWKGLKTLIIES
ncbi:nuclease A inhibitor family protein [Emticicia sp. 21SJ11W-3]|uniref:nuclease A inhibitor family protein n=1 Tax=Emticicia sp. 21SJ11W-3 TaxID=2916755 RepID=UPI00209DDF90|nr:nuclease A inhibitor family protein [Emticicia sp. 21SJ11W-3]UTA70276.1 nuclease A inhibitor family protein [Emticicia sp. 21SJ11W-3]